MCTTCKTAGAVDGIRKNRIDTKLPAPKGTFILAMQLLNLPCNLLIERFYTSFV